MKLFSKKALALLLSVMMILSAFTVLPFTVSAAGGATAIDKAMLSRNAKANTEQYPQNSTDGPAGLAFDGNSSTLWHARYNAGTARPGNAVQSKDGTSTNYDTGAVFSINNSQAWIQTGFDGETKTISQISYQGRGSTGNGRINQFQVWVSDSEDMDTDAHEVVNVSLTGSNYSATGNFSNNASEQIVYFEKPVECKYVRLVMFSTHSQQYPCIAEMNVYEASDNGSTSAAYQITPDTTEGEINKFTYSQNGSTQWVISENEAYSDVYTSTSNPESVYTEFYFVGSRVEIWGIRAPVHGIIKFYVDGVFKQEVDCYASARQSAAVLFSYDDENGEDRPHTVKIEATGRANASATATRAVIQFSYAKIWHGEYSLIDFELPESMDLFEKQTRKVNPASTFPTYATLDGAKYSIADQSIATVSEDGRVTGVKKGETTLTVTCNSVSRTMKIVVREAVPAIHAIIGDTNVRYSQDTYQNILDSNKASETLTAWKGDTALSQIAVISENSKISNVTVKASDFTNGSKRISASNVKLYFIGETLAFTGYANSYSPDVINANKVSVPDILMEAESADIDFDSVKGIWVEINVPKGTVAGTYTGTVTVSADEVDDIELNYELEVIDLTLPDVSDYTFDVELWQYPYSIAEYYGLDPFCDEHIEILKAHMAQYRDIGGYAITCSIVDDAWAGQTYSANEIHYPSMVEWIKQADGTFTYDYSDFDAWVTLNKEIGIGDKIVLYSIASWSGKIRYYDQSSGRYVTVTPSVGSTDWTTMWKNFLTNMISHLEEKGWFDDTYMGIDERGFGATQFNLIESVTGKNGKSMKTAGAFDSINDNSKVALSDRINDLSIGSAAAKSSPAAYANLVAQRKAKGLKTTIYTCTGHYPNNFTINMPGESYWIAFYTASQNSDGYMRWAYDAWVEDPLNDTTHSSFEAGDCFQVYPGDAANGYTTRSSLRLSKLAEGIRDINKIKYLESKMPSLASDIKALYAKVNTNYAYVTNLGAKYASDAVKEQLPIDMKALKEGVNEITEKYMEMKMLHPTIPRYEYPEEDLIVVDREKNQYLGQPDLVMLDDEKTIITVYPKGHGVGPTVMKISTDGGLTWSDRVENLPASWQNSQETPTIYKLNFTDGSQKLIMITACPGSWGNYTTGINTSISDDDGKTWTEYEHFFDGTPTIVAMASLIQLKDENGNYIDKWMGVYHNASYVNYKTYLTFDENGNQHWSTPEAYLSQWRSIESSHQICEVGMFRSPDGSRIVALARSQSHMHLSTMFYSDDEGQTWSEPKELPASLLGERHKAIYDPISGRLFITFREIVLDKNNDGVIASGDWYAGEWLAWVGTYEDIMNGNEGQYRIELAKDYAPSTYSGDTGYSGLCVTSDGTIFANSYGAFDPNDAKYNYILGARFKLADIDAALGFADTTELRKKLAEANELLESGESYDPDAVAALQEAVDKYTEYLGSNVSQDDVNAAVKDLDALIEALLSSSIMWGDVNGDEKVDSADATLVLQYFAHIIDENANGYNHAVSDVDGSGETDSADATLILQHFAKIITKFPVEG